MASSKRASQSSASGKNKKSKAEEEQEFISETFKRVISPEGQFLN